MMTYYKRERVRTPNCGIYCQGHTIYYGIDDSSLMEVDSVRKKAFKKAKIKSPTWHCFYDEKQVSSAEIFFQLFFGLCAVDDVSNIHHHKKVYITGKIKG